MELMVKRRIAFIFARGGSKGVPNKNIKKLAGKPLIGYSIETAKACGFFDSIIISTDSLEIAAIAADYGVEVPFIRPAELATDNASEWKAWQHAIQFVIEKTGQFDTFVSLPATSPFRNVEDVTECVRLLECDSDSSLVVSGKTSDRSPYFNMVTLDTEGYAHVVIPQTEVLLRRQDAPKVFDLTTVAYAARPQFILNSSNMWEGNVRMLEVPAERALDIDTHFDFFIAECIAENYLTNKADDEKS